MIVGTCELVDVCGPLTHDQLCASVDCHSVNREAINDSWPYQKTYAWVLTNAKRLRVPIPYQHPQGAVIWVKLPDDLLAEGVPYGNGTECVIGNTAQT